MNKNNNKRKEKKVNGINGELNNDLIGDTYIYKTKYKNKITLLLYENVCKSLIVIIKPCN